MEKINVLYIDDELLNLKAFQASFRRIYNVFIAKDHLEGIKILNENDVEVILCDQRMPNINGVDFFESILKTHPNPIRILITAYSDIEAVIGAINRGKVYKYITKPWLEMDLKLSIENAYQIYLLKEQNNKLTLKYKRIFNASSDPIILFDLKGRILEYNEATLNLVKTNKEKNLRYRTFNSLLKSKSNTKFIIDAIAKDGFIKDFQCKIIGKGNTFKDCLITVNSIKDCNGKIQSFQAIIKDYSKRSSLNQLLLKTTIEAQEKERERISRDLHDGLGQQLAAIRMHVEMIEGDFENNYDKIDKVKTLLTNSIADLRRICHNTIPLVLFDNGLIKAVENLIIELKPFNIEIDFSYDKNFPSLTKTLDISLFRVIQEFVSNSIKHSKASRIDISLLFDCENIELNLCDNGNGFKIDKLTLTKGNGLTNIRSRVESLNGDIIMDSVLDKNTLFKVTIPLR